MSDHCRHVQAMRGHPRGYGETYGHRPGVGRYPHQGEPLADDWLPTPTPAVLRDLARRMANVTPEGWRSWLRARLDDGADLSRPGALDATWVAYCVAALGQIVRWNGQVCDQCAAADLLSAHALAALRSEVGAGVEAMISEKPEAEAH